VLINQALVVGGRENVIGAVFYRFQDLKIDLRVTNILHTIVLIAAVIVGKIACIVAITTVIPRSPVLGNQPYCIGKAVP